MMIREPMKLNKFAKTIHCFKIIGDTATLIKEIFFYPCPFDPEFNIRDNANGFEINQSYYTFLNPPFDWTRTFMVKAIIDYR